MSELNLVPFEVSHPDGSTIRGFRNPPLACQGKAPAVILSHGFNGNVMGSRVRIAPFAAAGIHLFAYDFRGGSLQTSSDGKLSEMMTPLSEVADLRLMLDYVRSLPEVDPDRVFLMGESQGGFISALTAAQVSGIAGMSLWFPALVIPDDCRKRMISGSHEVFGIPLYPEYDRIGALIDPWSMMPAYSGPVLFLHGDQDPVVPLSYSQKAAKLYPQSSLTVYEGAGHGFGGADLEDAVARSIRLVKEGRLC